LDNLVFSVTRPLIVPWFAVQLVHGHRIIRGSEGLSGISGQLLSAGSRPSNRGAALVAAACRVGSNGALPVGKTRSGIQHPPTLLNFATTDHLNQIIKSTTFSAPVTFSRHYFIQAACHDHSSRLPRSNTSPHLSSVLSQRRKMAATSNMGGEWKQRSVVSSFIMKYKDKALRCVVSAQR
jgi:hypothetical protein